MHTPGVGISGFRRDVEHGLFEAELGVLRRIPPARASQAEDGRLVLLLAQCALLRRTPAIARVLAARAAELGSGRADGADGGARLRRRAGWSQALVHAAEQWRGRLSLGSRSRHPPVDLPRAAKTAPRRGLQLATAGVAACLTHMAVHALQQPPARSPATLGRSRAALLTNLLTILLTFTAQTEILWLVSSLFLSVCVLLWRLLLYLCWCCPIWTSDCAKRLRACVPLT